MIFDQFINRLTWRTVVGLSIKYIQPSSLILIQFSHARTDPPKEHEILMNEHVRMRTLQRAHDKDMKHQQWKEEVTPNENLQTHLIYLERTTGNVR